MNVVTNWRDMTRDALIQRPRTLTLEQIEADTGISRAWLKAFSRGVSGDPGVCRIETLYVYLTKSRVQG